MYWVGGAGTWDATTATNWSNVSGGAGGASAPRVMDNVLIDASSGTGTIAINAGATCANLTVTWTAAKGNTLSLGANFAPAGSVSINGNSTINRILIQSSSLGTARTFTAAIGSLSNVDFQDITAATGTPWTGASLGDCQGNSNITFDASVTQFWKTTLTGTQNWDVAGNWFLATNGGGGAGRVPLPQDDVVFDANSIGAASTTVNTNSQTRLGRNINFTGVTNTPTFTVNGGAGPGVFGSLTFAAGMVLTNWSSSISFRGRGGNYTITSAGLVWSTNFSVMAPTGTYTLADAFTSADSGGNNLTLTIGTFDTGGFNVKCQGTASGRLLQMTGGTLNMNGSTFEWAASNGGAIWNVTGGTLNAGTSTVKMSGGGANALTFVGGGKTYNNLWVTSPGTGSFTVSSSNVFNQFKVDNAPRTVLFTVATTQTIADWQVVGSAGNLITIDSTTTSNFTLTKSGGGIVGSDYLSVNHSTATPGTTWYAGSHSTDGGTNSGWIFTDGVVSASDSATGADAFGTIGVAFSDAGAGLDTAALAVSFSASDSASGADVSSLLAIIATSESATGADSFAIGLSFTDSASGADTSNESATVAASESGLGAEALGPVAFTVADTSSGSDGALVQPSAVVLGFSDVATGQDAASIAVTLATSESAAGLEHVGLLQIDPLGHRGPYVQIARHRQSVHVALERNEVHVGLDRQQVQVTRVRQYTKERKE